MFRLMIKSAKYHNKSHAYFNTKTPEKRPTHELYTEKDLETPKDCRMRQQVKPAKVYNRFDPGF